MCFVASFFEPEKGMGERGDMNQWMIPSWGSCASVEREVGDGEYVPAERSANGK